MQTNNHEQNIVGITMGCPASIGPEIILKFFQNFSTNDSFQPVVVGDLGVLRKCANELNLPATLQPWKPGMSVTPDRIPVLEASSIDCNELTWGSPTLETGKAMAGYIMQLTTLISEGKINGMVTCPISKSSLNSAGFNYPGHTEMLAKLTDSSEYGMMMAGNKLRVTLVTIHCALAEISQMLSVKRVMDMIDLTCRTLQKDFGIENPKIAVAGLNPHAGEDGLFGLEEEHVITPAIDKFNTAQHIAFGPFPPDTLFAKCIDGQYDAVVCMYHDQGLIPFKLIHFEDGVNVTMGLPIVRTSVDHGTAYDIAGKGIADSTSLTEAVKLAGIITNNRTRYQKRINE